MKHHHCHLHHGSKLLQLWIIVIWLLTGFLNPVSVAQELPLIRISSEQGLSQGMVYCMIQDSRGFIWVGTKNGVWLISPDGDKTIYRFTTENSPLPDNDVKQIAIDGNNGETFFSTAKGIVSFRSTATEGGLQTNNVLVFPNPVPPGYSGSIAIRGLVNNAIVKITELDGRLVYQTRALGGQAIWNGKNYKGQSIAAGIYLVIISDEGKQEKAVSRIVFINSQIP